MNRKAQYRQFESLKRAGLFRNGVGRTNRCLLKPSNWPEALGFLIPGMLQATGKVVGNWSLLGEASIIEIIRRANAGQREEEVHRRWTEREQRLGVGQS